MSARASGREIRVGLVVVLALAALMGLLAMAGGGPGFLADRRQIDVDFRNGQGIRPGSQVRIAGVESGRVVGVTLAEVEGSLRARVRLSVPADLAGRMKEDARIAIESSLTGQTRVNILSIGQSHVALHPGKVLLGVETSMFDPILEQVGLGPVERSNISHMIGEVRKTLDDTTPKVRQIVGAIDATVAGVKETSDSVRPVVASAVGNVDAATKRLAEASPRVEAILAQVDTLTAQVNKVLSENRPNIQQTIASVRDLSATLKQVVDRDQEKVSGLLDHVKGTMTRADLALYNAKQIGDAGLLMLTRNKVDIERTLANVKDATEWGSKLVQKIYANPFVLSPLYKPTPEDVRVQSAYDSAQVFASAAEKLDDSVKRLEQFAARPASQQQGNEIELVRRQILEVNARVAQMSQQFSDALKPRTRRGAPVGN
jgi:phospholipid/cholesterol/gamma-HCH transport system substrate-binding protein